MNSSTKNVLNTLQELNVIPSYINIEESGLNYLKSTSFIDKNNYIPQDMRKKDVCLDVIKNVRWLLTSEILNLNEEKESIIDEPLINKLAEIVTAYGDKARIPSNEKEILLIKENNGEYLETKHAKSLNSVLEHIKSSFKEIDALLGFGQGEFDKIQHLKQDIRESIQDELQIRINASKFVNEQDAYFNKETRHEMVNAAINQSDLTSLENQYFPHQEEIQKETTIWDQGYSKKRRITQNGKIWALSNKERKHYDLGLEEFTKKYGAVLDMTDKDDVRNFVPVKMKKNADASIINLINLTIVNLRKNQNISPSEKKDFLEFLDPSDEEMAEHEKQQFEMGISLTCNKYNINFKQFQQEWEKQRTEASNQATRGLIIYKTLVSLNKPEIAIGFNLNLQSLGGSCIEKSHTQEKIRKVLTSKLNDVANNPEINLPKFIKTVKSPLYTIISKELKFNLNFIQNQQNDEKIKETKRGLDLITKELKELSPDHTKIDNLIEKHVTMAFKEIKAYATDKKSPFRLSTPPTQEPGDKFVEILKFTNEKEPLIKQLGVNEIKLSCLKANEKLEDNEKNMDSYPKLASKNLSSEIESQKEAVKLVEEANGEDIWQKLKKATRVAINPKEFTTEQIISAKKTLEIIKEVGKLPQNNKEKNQFYISNNAQYNIKNTIGFLNKNIRKEGSPKISVSQYTNILAHYGSPLKRWIYSKEPQRHIESLKNTIRKKENTEMLTPSKAKAMQEHTVNLERAIPLSLNKVVKQIVKHLVGSDTETLIQNVKKYNNDLKNQQANKEKNLVI